MNLTELAMRQLADFDRREPGTVFSEPAFQLTSDQAYDLQFEVTRLRIERGEPIAGYKIGCLSRTMQNQLGLDRPVFGHVWNSELHRTGARLQSENYDGLAIEGEFAVRLQDDVPSADWLRHNPDVANGFVVIELHNSIFRGPASLRAAELIANNAIHAGVVLPNAEAPVLNVNELLDTTLQVTRNGELLGEATARELEGGPLAGMVRLVEHLEQRGRRLLRGQIILTGSPLPLWPVNIGDRIEVRCDQQGTAVGMQCADRQVVLTIPG